MSRLQYNPPTEELAEAISEMADELGRPPTSKEFQIEHPGWFAPYSILTERNRQRTADEWFALCEEMIESHRKGTKRKTPPMAKRVRWDYSAMPVIERVRPIYTFENGERRQIGHRRSYELV